MNEREIGYELVSIGHSRRTKGAIYLEILEPYRPGLKQLDHFSHVMVLWWADQMDDDQHRSIMQCRPPYAVDKITGVFACRSEYRPNPIAVTTCAVEGLDLEDGIVRVENIDAVDGTPIVDLKGYFPVLDRVREASIPEWLEDWPEWMPPSGIGLEVYEE